MYNLTLKQLKAFVALKKERNFTRAASDLKLSQPALSELINNLESILGFRVFERDTRNVRLTSDGEEFASIAARILRVYDEALIDISAIGRGSHGRVAVAAIPSVIGTWLPTILPKFKQKYPEILVKVFDVHADLCLQYLEDDVADLAVVPFSAGNAIVASEEIFSEQFFFVCLRTHPFAGQKGVTLRQLTGTHIINIEGSMSIKKYLPQIFIGGNVLLDSIELQQLTTVYAFLKAGHGAAIVPSLALYQFSDKDFVIIPFSESVSRRRLYLIQRTDKPLSAAAQYFRSLLKDQAMETSADGYGDCPSSEATSSDNNRSSNSTGEEGNV